MKKIGEKPRKSGFQLGRGFYQKAQPPAKKKVDLENVLARFTEDSEKMHDETDAVIRGHQNIMKEKEALLRNHQASIHNIEVQLGQLTTLVQDKLSPKIPKKKPHSQVMMIETEEEAISKFLEALEVEPQLSEPKPKKSKIEETFSAETPDSRREPSKLTTWAESEQKNSANIPAYRPPLPFPSRANSHPLEKEHLEFMKQVKGISINTHFIKSLSKIPEYARFLQDLIDTRQPLKKNSKVALSEQSSNVVLGELSKKMGDRGCLTLPCEFGNSLKTYALADSGLKATRMTIHMANRSVTHPRGIVEDILVKIGKFVFPIDFVVMDMKEDHDVPIILGRPLLNTVGALVDIHESKLTLRVGDDEATFGIEDGFQGNDVQGEVFNVDKEEDELEELEKLMEELKIIQQVKHTKPRESVRLVFEVIAYTNPTSWVSEESEDLSSDEDEVTFKETSLAMDEKVVPVEQRNEKLENKGIRHKLEVNEVEAIKENSKKAYIRRV
ncbi:uncharacterized protein LOC111882785 [Lactuca sativa]|uniref:uncharacterized protein LOC111882785 n=1 Tax=Lactuca sativa TaxID=4236 RepID=UPI000CD8344E|nr:uncharacterized protein LOC111882785 [Lactuca sativa]